MSSIDEKIEAFVSAAIDQSEADKASNAAKEIKDAIALDLIPFIKDAADDGKSYEVVRAGKVLGKLNVTPSTSYVPAEGITYDELIANGLMIKREGEYIRWWPKSIKTKKEAQRDDETV